MQYGRKTYLTQHSNFFNISALRPGIFLANIYKNLNNQLAQGVQSLLFCKFYIFELHISKPGVEPTCEELHASPDSESHDSH